MSDDVQFIWLAADTKLRRYFARACACGMEPPYRAKLTHEGRTINRLATRDTLAGRIGLMPREGVP